MPRVPGRGARDRRRVRARARGNPRGKLKAVARALYADRPDADRLAAFGLTLDDLDDTVGIYPDNDAAVDVFVALGTQWRVGMGGPTGLDYAALPAVLRLRGVPRADWPDTFDCVRVMEAEALRVMHEGKNHG